MRYYKLKYFSNLLHCTQYFTLFLISLALWAKFSVDRVSPKHLDPGWTFAIMAVLALPPRESCLMIQMFNDTHFQGRNCKIFFKQRKRPLSLLKGWEIIQLSAIVSTTKEGLRGPTKPPDRALYPEQEGELGVSVADMPLFSVAHIDKGGDHLAQAAQRSVYVTCFLRHRGKTKI